MVATPERSPPPPAKKRRWNFRKWLRALHRDAGYLAVGLTLVYAFSGLAVNHIEDWDPNFTQVEETHQIDADEVRQMATGTSGDARPLQVARAVLQRLGRSQAVGEDDVYALDENHVDITLESTTLYVDLETGVVREEGQQPRLLLRAANWLHLNRGKQAWTIVADGYAIALLFLACSGMFMIKGQQGFLGRGAVLVSVGVAIPVLYVVLSGGP